VLKTVYACGGVVDNFASGFFALVQHTLSTGFSKVFQKQVPTFPAEWIRETYVEIDDLEEELPEHGVVSGDERGVSDSKRVRITTISAIKLPKPREVG